MNEGDHEVLTTGSNSFAFSRPRERTPASRIRLTLSHLAPLNISHTLHSWTSLIPCTLEHLSYLALLNISHTLHSWTSLIPCTLEHLSYLALLNISHTLHSWKSLIPCTLEHLSYLALLNISHTFTQITCSASMLNTATVGVEGRDSCAKALTYLS